MLGYFRKFEIVVKYFFFTNLRGSEYTEENLNNVIVKNIFILRHLYPICSIDISVKKEVYL